MSAKILIVEDEDEIREVIAAELEDAGYVVAQAPNGKDGLAAIKAHNPDLILSDISMPELDGIGMIEALRKEQPTKADIPFIFLTAYSDRERQISARRFGADEFLNKPVDFELLLAVVENQIEKRRSSKVQHDAELVNLFKKMQSGSEPAPTGIPGVSETTEAPQSAADSDERPASPKENSQNAALALGGRITMLGLNEAKQLLGANWDNVASTVMQIAENKIAQNVSADDTYRVLGEDSFEVCIQGVGESEATSVIRRIKQEIMDAISGLDAAPDSNITETEVAALRNVQSEFYPVQPTALGITQDDLMDVISAKIERASKNFAENSRQMLAQIVQDSDICLIPVLNANFKKTTAAICMLDQSSRTVELRMRNALSDDTQKMLELDMAKLGLAIQSTLSNTDNTSSKFIVPVDIRSLVSPKSRQRYLGIINSMPEMARSGLVLLAENGLGNVHPSILIDVVRSLKPFSISCWLRTSVLVPDDGSLDGGLVPVVAMNYFDIEANVKKHPDQLKNFRKMLSKNKVSLLIDGIEEESQKTNSSYLNQTYYGIEA